MGYSAQKVINKVMNTPCPGPMRFIHYRPGPVSESGEAGIRDQWAETVCVGFCAFRESFENWRRLISSVTIFLAFYSYLYANLQNEQV